MAWGPDEFVHDWITDHRTPLLVDIARAVTLAGDSIVVGAVTVIAGVVLTRRARHWQPIAFAVAGWLAVEIVARLLKAVVDRDRPPFEDAVVQLAHGSLPAAHVARATYALVMVGLCLDRRWRRSFAAGAAVIVAAVAWSRLELGTHWLTDTLVAWPLGLLFALPAARSVRKA